MCSSGGVRGAFWALFFDRRSGAGVEQFGLDGVEVMLASYLRSLVVRIPVSDIPLVVGWGGS